jgi:hypothetical protein
LRYHVEAINVEWNPKRVRKIAVRVLMLVLVLLIGGVAFDLYYPRTTHLREFDARSFGLRDFSCDLVDRIPRPRTIHEITRNGHEENSP